MNTKTLQDFLERLSLESEMKNAMDKVSRLMSRYQKADAFDLAKESPTSAITKIYYLFREYDKNHEYYENEEVETMYYLERLLKLVVEGYEELEDLIHE